VFDALLLNTCCTSEQTHREVSHLNERHVAKAQNQHAQVSAIYVFSTGRLWSVAKQTGMEKSQGVYIHHKQVPERSRRLGIVTPKP
jgi:hypothetical protein